ncbi:MAG TPA: rhodanese-like domain-containing protein [Methylomirabilota bacterium]|jgi:thiosulfate/3-mercaptopyruvate sulfurtransferase
MAWPRPLITPAELAPRLDAPELRLVECGVVYRPLPDRQDFRVESARPLYGAGHLPGAVFVDVVAELSDPASGLRFTMPEPARIAEAFGRHGVGPGTFTVLYCRDHNIFAARLWWMLRSIGWDDAAVLNGGFVRWVAEGRPVTTEARSHPPARLEPRPRAGLFVDKAAVRRALGDSRAVVVNALSAEQHEGRGGVTYGRPGRIAGSVSVSARALTDPKTHAYLPTERIRAAFEAAGVLRPGGDAVGRRAVTYCGAGIAASSDAFLLTLLGMDDVAVYDGSLEEWARDPACPMESGPVAP